MLNTLTRHLARSLRVGPSKSIFREFSNNFKYREGQWSEQEELPTLDFLKSEDLPKDKPQKSESTELETDLDYLEEHMEAEDAKLLLATSTKKIKKLEFLNSDDFAMVVRKQDLILQFEFPDFMKLTDYKMTDKIQRLMESTEIKVLIKIRLVTHLPEFQTIANMSSIIDQAINENYEDKDKEFEILVGSLGNSAQVLQDSIKSALSKSCKDLSFEQVNVSLFSLISSIVPETAKRLLVTAMGKKGSKAADIMERLNLLADTGKVFNLLDETISDYLVKHAHLCSFYLLLETMSYLSSVKNIKLEETIDLVETACPKVDWIKLLEYSPSSLSKLSKDQKLILYFVFSRQLSNKRMKVDPHRYNLVSLLDSLLMHDEVYSNYLVRTMVGSLG